MSITYGLPELIKEADVDNDMPTDCVLEHIDSDQLSHPLPGENTHVSLFYQYIMLTRKLSAILDLLYTTTRRRGATGKISRLDRDLRVWNCTFNGLPHVVPFEIGEPPRRSFEDDNHEGRSMLNHWLQLLANIAMVQIHRPALTFDTATPEFTRSMSVCIKASAVIIELLEDKNYGGWLQKICPSGPAVVFQSALMHVYSHCSLSIPESVGRPSREASIALISRAAQLLSSYSSTNWSQNEGASARFRDRSLREVIQTLRLLQGSLVENTQSSTIPTVQGSFGDFETAPNYVSPHIATQATSSVEAWNSNALEYLNNIDTVDWMWTGAEQFGLAP